MSFALGSCPGSPAPHLVRFRGPSLLSHAPLPHQLATPWLLDHSASPHVPAWLPEGQGASVYQRDGRPALTELTLLLETPALAWGQRESEARRSGCWRGQTI